MKLTRYNEVVFALAGTLFLIALVVLAGFLALTMSSMSSLYSMPEEVGVVVDRQGAAAPGQNLVFCPSLTDATGVYQYIPVAVVVAEDSPRGLFVDASRPVVVSPRKFDDCVMYRYGGASRTFNVVVRNLERGEQRVLLGGPAQIVSFSLPSDTCAEGEGEAPCGTLLWKIRDRDTDGNGTINSDDALAAYASGLDASRLVPLTPPDATLLGTQWIAEAQLWQFQIRRDTNGDGHYTDEDGSELVETSAREPAMAEAFLSSQIRSVLEASIK